MQAPPDHSHSLSHQTKLLRADHNSIVTPGGVAAVRYRGTHEASGNLGGAC